MDFFCELHSPEKNSEDIADGLVGILMVGEQAVGTGCYREKHITRVYVRHDYQGKGCGSFIMDCLETEIEKHCSDVELDFYYQHLNQSDEIRAGKCHSIPLVKNGKLEMHGE